MDLSNPIRSVAPSLESAVLEVLANTESGLNASQIARLSGRGSRNGQAPVLDRLVEHGLVLADPAPTGHLYRMNRAHVLAPAVEAAANAREAAIDRIRTAAADLTPPPVHTSLFGSVARGEARPESDIDLLIVVPDHVDVRADPWLDQMSVLSDSVMTWTGNRLEPLVFTNARFAEIVADDEAIVREWISDAIDLTGQPLRTLPAIADRFRH